jgi:type I restriction enzyme M protein
MAGNGGELEKDLWEAADQLRANSKLTATEYCMPVLGIIFLRHAANRFEAAARQIQEDQAAGRMPKRPLIPEDYLSRRALFLPEKARYASILALPKERDLGKALIEAMEAIEDSFPPLAGVLPKDYGIFDRVLLEDLLRIFNKESLQSAPGDVFGRIYEYFLEKFSIEKAMDNGEFFTPPSLVQTIVNVIEPEHGIVFDPACGSGGMFVQTSHFIERLGQNTAHKVTFYGQEKTATTIKLAKMNLAVHGLEGDIREANTFYEDAHTLFGKCDFVMANPPFNVDMVDAEKVKDDRRLPFGLPGVNKQKKVSNGNYLWISYFHSYLNPKGRAGFVMSSQASSAGHAEKEVRRKIVQTGDVDVMVAIRSNFFYTRTVPCELWHFDRAKPERLRDKVLMLDARNIYRKVTRKIYDFSPEQLANLAAIVALYRGRQERFLALVQSYLERTCAESAAVEAKLTAFQESLAAPVDALASFAEVAGKTADLDDEACRPLLDAVAELKEAKTATEGDAKSLVSAIAKFNKTWQAKPPEKNKKQHEAAKDFEPVAEAMKGLIKQVDLLYKLAGRGIDAANGLASHESLSEAWDRRGAGRQVKALDAARKEAVEQLKRAGYFYRQARWLQERFPDAELRDVPGLVKVVTLAEIEAADWSLTPGRYVGVAPPEVDEEFDFEQALKDIHLELKGLDEEAAELAKKIQENFEELGG